MESEQGVYSDMKPTVQINGKECFSENRLMLQSGVFGSQTITGLSPVSFLDTANETTVFRIDVK